MQEPSDTSNAAPPDDPQENQQDLSPPAAGDEASVCTQCGRPIDPSDITCPHCGTALVGG